jgi:hypothetical protein
MQTHLTRPVGFMTSLLASLTMAFAVGCASGGFKLTRSYAELVNRQNVVVRVVLYILTSVIFVVTMLIDLVYYNTMDFWDGRVAAGDYTFQQGEKTFLVKHEVLPGAPLKRSTIEIVDRDKKLLQTVVLQETTAGEIELRVDGRLRTKVRDLSSLPMITSYDALGTMTSDRIALVEMPPLTVAASAR